MRNSVRCDTHTHLSNISTRTFARAYNPDENLKKIKIKQQNESKKDRIEEIWHNIFMQS